MICKSTSSGLYFKQYSKADVAPIDLPHKINFLKSFCLKQFIMLSLRKPNITNVFLLFHPVSDKVSFAFTTSREIEGAECKILWNHFQNIGALESIGAITVHKEYAYIWITTFLKQRCIQFFVILVDHTMDFMFYICNIGQIL